jgi:NitT/TauT family transport system substrate-binding protein
MKNNPSSFSLIVGVVLLMLPHPPAFAAGKVNISYAAISAAAVPLWAAQDRGFFKKHGLDAELIYLAGGSRVALGIESNSTPIGFFNVASGVDARLAGGGTLMTGSVYDGYYFQIFGKQTIQSPKELKGKVIAASRAGAASEYGIRDALSHYGLKENDYKIIYVGGTDARVQVLQQGLVDASIISPPHGLIAQKLGFKEIINLMQMNLPFGYFGIGAKDSWLKQNGDAMRSFLKGYLEGLALCRKDREDALKLIGKYSRLDDREILLESYRTSVPLIAVRPYVKKEIIEASLKLSKNEKARGADAEKFYDNSFVKELDASGFLTSLFGKD